MALFLQKRGVSSQELEGWSPARRMAAFIVHTEDENPVRWSCKSRQFISLVPKP